MVKFNWFTKRNQIPFVKELFRIGLRFELVELGLNELVKALSRLGFEAREYGLSSGSDTNLKFNLQFWKLKENKN